MQPPSIVQKWASITFGKVVQLFLALGIWGLTLKHFCVRNTETAFFVKTEDLLV